LSALTSPKVPFTWSPAADRDLKHHFTTAPILVYPDPSRKFVVEADVLDVGVGAVLSQRSGLDLKLHPCGFFSHHLNAMERTYNVGNREVLAVKMVLVEWRHWLEGAEHLFIVWTEPAPPRASIPGKLGGPCCSLGSTSPCHNGRDPRMSSRMRCHAAISPRLHPQKPRPSFPARV
jgi:hypothetical protein